MEDTDEVLLARYVDAGDGSAFEALFRRYGGRITALFRRNGAGDTLAEDLAQQTFLQVHRARADFRRDGRVRPWIFAIALNTQREHWRRLKRRPEEAFEPERHVEPSVAPGTSSASDRLVRRALASLPEAQREVIVLHWFEGLPFEEIAAVVGASRAAVKVRAHRGYERLRVALQP